jgi:hypothetical protein
MKVQEGTIHLEGSPSFEGLEGVITSPFTRSADLGTFANSMSSERNQFSTVSGEPPAGEVAFCLIRPKNAKKEMIA